MSLRFSNNELAQIDAAWRKDKAARCPLDDKPLLTTTWSARAHVMVYFVCRNCTRIGAVAYDRDDEAVAGVIAKSSP